jgi:nitrogen regulatory protein P-II 1
MKKVEAIVRPEKLDAVKAALDSEGIVSMTISEVRGRGEQRGIPLQYRGKAIRVDLLPKVKLEMAVDDGSLEKCIRTIAKTAWTGRPGDGKIFVLPVEACMKIREKGAIQDDGEKFNGGEKPCAG